MQREKVINSAIEKRSKDKKRQKLLSQYWKNGEFFKKVFNNTGKKIETLSLHLDKYIIYLFHKYYYHYSLPEVLPIVLQSVDYTQAHTHINQGEFY